MELWMVLVLILVVYWKPPFWRVGGSAWHLIFLGLGLAVHAFSFTLTIHFTLSKKSHCRSDQIVHYCTYTHSDQFHCRSDQLSTTALTHTLTNCWVGGWGRGCADSYISFKGLPLVDLWDGGGGGSISQSMRMIRNFPNLFGISP